MTQQGMDPNLLSRIFGYDLRDTIPGIPSYPARDIPGIGRGLDVAGRMLIPGAETTAMAQRGDASTAGLLGSLGMDLAPVGAIGGGLLGGARRMFPGMARAGEWMNPAWSRFQDLYRGYPGRHAVGPMGTKFTQPYDVGGRNVILSRQGRDPASPTQAFYQSRTAPFSESALTQNLQRGGAASDIATDIVRDISTTGRYVPLAGFTGSSPVGKAGSTASWQELSRNPEMRQGLMEGMDIPWWMAKGDISAGRYYNAVKNLMPPGPYGRTAPLETMMYKYGDDPRAFEAGRALDRAYGPGTKPFTAQTTTPANINRMLGLPTNLPPTVPTVPKSAGLANVGTQIATAAAPAAYRIPAAIEGEEDAFQRRRVRRQTGPSYADDGG